MRRAPAYARQRRFLSGAQLLAGVISLERDIPPTNIDLLAPAAALTVRDSFHPALVGLLLEIDHRVPFARGGTNTPENLRVLCRAHNLFLAEQTYGESFVREKIRAQQQQQA